MPGIAIPDNSWREDDEYERDVQRQLDDEREAKKHASGISAEELSMIDAGNAGRKAGMLGHGSSMNPFDHSSPEHAEWNRQRLATISARLNRQLRKLA